MTLLGFEPAIQKSLETLLVREPGLELTPPETIPDVIVAAPPSPEWLSCVRQRFPTSRLLAMVEWNHRDRFARLPVDGYFDRFQGYPALLEMLTVT